MSETLEYGRPSCQQEKRAHRCTPEGSGGIPRMLGYIGFLLLISCGFPHVSASRIEDANFWYSEARSHIEHLKQSQKSSSGFARNVILFIADGMGVTTLTAARIMKGQRLGLGGEEYKMVFESFPYVALAKTYNLDAQIGESSACATALMCGVKARVNTVGLDHRGHFNDCMSSYSARVDSLIDWSQKHGKSTGIVTNTRLTHGTPSALYAHSASRYWEDDTKMPQQAKAFCKDITRQLVEDDPGKNINVLMGGGRRHWLPSSVYDAEEKEQTGRRGDGRDLIQEWLQDKRNRDLRAQYVWNKHQFEEVDPEATDYLLGIFGFSHLDFEVDRNKGPLGDPSLPEMTTKAIEILKKNPHGFFLMVEGGRIDHAHHHNNGKRALEEVGYLDDAVAAAVNIVDLQETLIILTSDHSHVMSFGGENTPRGHPVTDLDIELSDLDYKPYTTILYGNGPGYAHGVPKGRQNLTGINTQDINFVQQAAVPRRYETHGGEDVPVFARGPGAPLFSGIFEQTYVAHAIAHAACINEERTLCENPLSDDACVSSLESSTRPTQTQGTLRDPAPAPVEQMKKRREPWNWNSSVPGSEIRPLALILALVVPCLYH